MPETKRFDVSKLSPEDRERLAELKAKLSPEDRELLAELAARLKVRLRELGLDRTMTTRELLAKHPAIATGGTISAKLAAEDRLVDEAKGEVKPG